jgi:hypothetical protein
VRILPVRPQIRRLPLILGLLKPGRFMMDSAAATNSFNELWLGPWGSINSGSASVPFTGCDPDSVREFVIGEFDPFYVGGNKRGL